MTATVLAWTGALWAAAAPPAASPPPAVRLAPVHCGDLADATVRAPLRVELGHRLLDEDAADGPDLLLISIACQGSDATVVAVRLSGSAPGVRRVVRLGDVALEARPRELALAAVELIHVADLRDVPPAIVAPPPTVDRTPVPSSRPPRSWRLTISASYWFWASGYVANGFLPAEGLSLSVGVEHGPQRPASPSWQWAVTTELTAVGGRYQSGVTGGLMALVQRRGGLFVPELGFGARAGSFSETTTNVVAGGPVASVGLGLRFVPGASLDVGLETGYDLHGPGAWILPGLGYTARF